MDPRQPLSVRQIMVENPVVAGPGTTAQEAAARMAERNIGCVVVCQNEAIRGIFTERDLLRRAASTPRWESLPVSEFMTPDPITVTADDPLEKVVDLLGRVWLRHLPVVEGDRLVGILSVRDLMRHHAQYLASVVAEQTAELVGKNEALQKRDRLMDHHLDIAGRIQRQLLPASPYEFLPLSLAVRYEPLERVSGDYYDFTILSPDALGILIADASGHGVPAAFASVMAKMVFYAYGRNIDSPAAVLRTMNDHLIGLLKEERFVTAIYAVADRKSLALTYAAAGHPPPLWLHRRSGIVETLDAGGAMIGVTQEPDFDEHTVHLAPGDTILFYTDGLTEARNRERELFGRQRIAAVLRSQAGAAADSLLNALLDRLHGFRGGQAAEDDTTCIALGIGPPDAPTL